jgi:hypothetical protein
VGDINLFNTGTALATIANMTADDTGAPPPTALSIGDTTMAPIGKVFQWSGVEKGLTPLHSTH